MKFASLLLIVCTVYAVEGSRPYGHNKLSCRPCPIVPVCGDKRYCSYGDEKDFCKCCDRCLQGPGEQCGGRLGLKGNCAAGLFCDKSRRYQTSRTNPEGTCQYISGNCHGYCDPYKCPRVYCPFGTEKDACGCCDVCLKGRNEQCGGYNNEFGRCAEGFFCDEARVVFGKQPGVCSIWTAFDSLTSNQYQYGYGMK